MDPEPLPEEVIEGMPAGWLEKYLGEETARQVRFCIDVCVRVGHATVVCVGFNRTACRGLSLGILSCLCGVFASFSDVFLCMNPV